jgi:single-strand DNA-binding protein
MFFNSVTLVGRLCQDPELRYTNSGTAVANVTLAVDREYANEDGERDTDFIRITIWGKQAELVAEYKQKGDLVLVDGRIQTRSWEDEDGDTHYVTEVVADKVRFLSFRNQDEEEAPKSGKGGNSGKAKGSGKGSKGGKSNRR